jgi:hypothetical protein
MLMPIMISMTPSYHNSKLYYRFISVLFHNSNILFITVFFSLAVFISSCEEKATIIGSDMLPGKDFVNIISTDTIDVDAYSLYYDSVVANTSAHAYLGRLYDPYFGDTKIDFVGQLRLLGKWSGKGMLPIVDSVKLLVTITAAKGTLDTTTIRQIKLYEITEQLNPAVKYYSNRDPNAGIEIGTFNLPVIDTDTTKSIEIKLPNSFGEYLLRDTTKLEQEGDANDFRSFFKGLYVTMVDSPSPIVFTIEFSSAVFGINVYYHDYKYNTYNYDFVINTNSAIYNRYIHVFKPATAPVKVDSTRFGTKDTLIYLQAFNGVFPKLKMPGLKAIKKMLVDSVTNVSHGSINRARLTFSVLLDSSVYTTSTVPPRILMKYIKSDSLQYIVPDYLVNSSFFDGTFNTTAKTYSFNLASFVQEYLKGHFSEPEVEMYYPDGEYRNVILKANNSKTPVKFEFTYTRF